MISREEIDSKSEELEIHTANVERDYVFGWVIYGLFNISDLKNDIFLKGGNALRKGYFANTRFSSDLDFGIPGDIEQTRLVSELKKVCEFVQTNIGVLFDTDQTRVKEKFIAGEEPTTNLRVYEARIYFKDFYGKQDHLTIKVVMDITRFDKVLLPIQKVELIHPYSDAAQVRCHIRCMKLEEIVATKLKCLLQRQHAPDLFDYVHSIKVLGGNLNRKEVIQAFIAKTIFYNNPHVAKDILRKTAFDFFRETWQKTIVCAKQVVMNVEDAITTFSNDLEKLFRIYPQNPYNQFAYFTADLRIPIMKAAREQTMLKVTYKDQDRMIEPYSLKYMRRKNGEEREYFYAYNASGGNNPPGVRAFVSTGFSAIENTDQQFKPRYQIELSKAGELPENPYLFDPNRPLPIKRSKLSSFLSPKRPKANKLRYVYQCSFCGKRFTKATQNGTLNPHKGKNGYPCNGRRGFYVTTKYS